MGGMPRTVELGRAVLQSPSAQLQLWLTTLITVSPEQEETNLSQLSQTALLELLTSGKVWVRRGNGMHLILKLTMVGERRDQLHIERLANGIISAPAWKQLKLLASLPLRHDEYAQEASDQNVVRININYAPIDSDQSSPSRHHILADVPYTDVQPPDGIPRICLESVQFSMEILNMRDLIIRKPPKRQKHIHLQWKATNKNTQHSETYPHLSEEAEIKPGRHTSESNGFASASSTPTRSKIVKSPLLPNDLADKTLRNSDVVFSVGNFVDVSIRLAIGTISTRTFKGLDVKASAFATTLGRICPALWRPAYLQTLSHRARLIPTIGRSIGRITKKCSALTSLHEKLNKVSNSSKGSSRHNQDDYPNPASILGAAAAIQCGLWTNIQNEIQAQRVEQLQPFFRYDSHNKPHNEGSESDSVFVEAKDACEQRDETDDAAGHDDLFALFDSETTIVSRTIVLDRLDGLNDAKHSYLNPKCAGAALEIADHRQPPRDHPKLDEMGNFSIDKS